MAWVVVDVLVVGVALVAVVLAGLALWRRVRALGRDLRVATDRVGEVTRAVEDRSAARAGALQPSPAGHLPSAPRRRSSPRGA